MHAFLDYLSTLPDSLLYLALGLSAFVENLVPPIPGDTITAFGAFLVGIGRLSLPGVFIATTLGSLLGISLAGGLCRLKGRWVVLLAFVSCAIWNLIWILLGHVLGTHWAIVEAKLTLWLVRYNLVAFSLVILLIIAFITYRVIKRRKS